MAVNSRHGFSLPVEPIAVTSDEQLNEAGLRELRGATQRLQGFQLSDLLPRRYAALGRLTFPYSTLLLTYMKATQLNL